MFWLLRSWRAAISCGFAAVLLRFLGASFQEFASNLGPTLLAVASSVALGVFLRRRVHCAFIISLPLLSGISQLGLAYTPPLPSLVFAAFWIGSEARVVFDAVARRNGAVNRFQNRIEVIAVDLLATATFCSLAWQATTHHTDPTFWPTFWTRPTLGYGDQFYFLTSAFVWLQGLFFFKALTSHFYLDSPYGPIDSSAEEAENVPRIATGLVFPMFFTLTIAMGLFLFIEYRFHVPEAWITAGFQSPFEDISSFGSFGVAAFIMALATIIKRRNIFLQIVWVTGLLGLVIASWSRATWLAAIIFSFAVAWFRLSRWTIILFLAGTISLVSYVNYNADRPSWGVHPYWFRLVGLVRIEKFANKDPTRVELWSKAKRMICENPITGHGIGSFYLDSIRYGRFDDPYASRPDFAHNAILQIAAEEGVGVAAFFFSLIALAVWRGTQLATRQDNRLRHTRLVVLGTTLSLGAYLETQMTANSLNVYVSNQFFFWFLMALLFALSGGILFRCDRK